MPDLTPYVPIVAGIGGLFVFACFFALLITKKKKKKKTETPIIQVELSSDINQIFQKAYEHAAAKLGEFETSLQKRLDEVDEFNQTLTSDLKQTSANRSELIDQTKEQIDRILKESKEQSQSLQKKLAEQDAVLIEERKKILTETKQQSQDIIAEAKKQTAAIVSQVSQNYDDLSAKIREEVTKALLAENEKIMLGFKDDLLNITKQSEDIIHKTEQQAWTQVEQFNSQLLDAYENISNKIIHESEERAQKVGDRVLQKVEEDIVSFVIGVVHDTIEMTLTPEEHQKIIMQAVQNMKRQLHLGQIQKTTEDDNPKQKVVASRTAAPVLQETTKNNSQTPKKEESQKENPVQQTPQVQQTSPNPARVKQEIPQAPAQKEPPAKLAATVKTNSNTSELPTTPPAIQAATTPDQPTPISTNEQQNPIPTQQIAKASEEANAPQQSIASTAAANTQPPASKPAVSPQVNQPSGEIAAAQVHKSESTATSSKQLKEKQQTPAVPTLPPTTEEKQPLLGAKIDKLKDIPSPDAAPQPVSHPSPKTVPAENTLPPSAKTEVSSLPNPAQSLQPQAKQEQPLKSQNPIATEKIPPEITVSPQTNLPVEAHT